ncbi:unnamed protein product, partial [Mesorhabditis belari]|uniref:LEM domain-containing protein n=1 Tax=Mesorhabditis belari TaxID=2138241 RepID=A0AAF3FHL1_9BILA
MADVLDKLSDTELRETLLQHGINCGPVTETTRSLYLKKLRKAIGTDASVLEESSASATVNEQTPNLKLTPTRERSSPNRLYPDLSPQLKQRTIKKSDEAESGSGSESEMHGEESFRYVSRESSPSTNGNSTFKKLLLWILLFVVLAVFGYYLATNIEKLYVSEDAETI